jgi:hypothetical protein
MKAAIRQTVDDVDYKVGGTVSSLMCSHVCPCDFDVTAFDEDTEEKKRLEKWTTLFADDTILTKYDRCRVDQANCAEDKQIIAYKGAST